jgi:hypothetical protein
MMRCKGFFSVFGRLLGISKQDRPGSRTPGIGGGRVLLVCVGETRAVLCGPWARRIQVQEALR